MKKIVLTKENAKKVFFWMKFSIAAGNIWLFGGLILMFTLPFFIEINDPNAIFVAVWVIGLFVLSVPYLYLVFTVEDPNNVGEWLDRQSKKKTNAQKYKTKIETFDNFLSITDNHFKGKNYSQICSEKFENYNMYVYAKPIKNSWSSLFSALDLIMILRAEELTAQILENSTFDYTKLLESYYNETFDDIAYHINMTTIVCVDRVSSEFSKLMNGGAEQEFRTGRIIAGISFCGRGVYVAKNVGGFGITKYKKNRKEFFELFDWLIAK